jgi:DNA-binding MarR family transcriptional regulator
MQIEKQLNTDGFINPYIKVGINIQYTASWVFTFVTSILKKYNLSLQQYNVLRALELSHPKPLSIKDISESMVDINSNVSRLVDKLVDKQLTERHQEDSDKRKVKIIITKQGIVTVQKSTAELIEQFTQRAKTISEEEAVILSDLLDKLRS